MPTGLSFRKQPSFEEIVESGPTVLTTAVVSGLVSYVQILDPFNDIPAFSTRFESLYQEYRCRRCDATIWSVNNLQGMYVAYWSNTSSSPPTFPEQADQEQYKGLLTNANQKRSQTLTWRASEVNDQVWTPTTTSFAPAAFKLFSNSTNFAGPVVASPALVVYFKYYMGFRGYA